SIRLGMVAAFAVLAISVPAGLAQTPVATPVAADGPHPAHIHSGSCAELGDVVFPLTSVEALSGEAVGSETAHEVKTSNTFLDVSLDDILAGDHAINVHLSDEEIGAYIACGDIGGVLVEDEDGGSNLIIALGELNDSGDSGVVWLGAAGEQTEISITLIEPDELD
ncbi:MAG: hypothetical protein M3490_08975, partial [Chloroflexota bacterium]|nr:hypothetical protein [Chloroflexota bacterium]